MSRAVHAAARGGSVEMLRELLEEGPSSVSTYLDIRGSTVLHAAAGRGQLQVRPSTFAIACITSSANALLAVLAVSRDPCANDYYQ